MTKWIERYRRQAEERYARLDALLARMGDEEDGPAHNQTSGRRPDTTEGAAS
jgi:hypothetical protein